MKFQTCIAKRVFTYVRAPPTVMRKQILLWMVAIWGTDTPCLP